MLLQITTAVNIDDKDAEDNEKDKNYEDKIRGKHKEIRQKKSVGMAEDLDDEERI